MSANLIVANVVFSAGWVAVGAAALYARYKKSLEGDAREPGAELRGNGREVQAALTEDVVGATWTKDLASLAAAVGTAANVPHMERESKGAGAELANCAVRLPPPA